MSEKKSILEKWGIIQKVDVESDDDVTPAEDVVVPEEEELILQTVGDGKGSIIPDVPIQETVTEVAETDDSPSLIADVYVGDFDSNVDIDADKFIGVQELYAIYKFAQAGQNTVFMIDNYNKALPESLPDDLRKVTVLNILKASELNVDALIDDGLSRIEKLNEFLEVFSQRSDTVISACETEIRKLDEKIQEYRNRIDNRRILQQKQVTTIEYESKRINDAIAFVKN